MAVRAGWRLASSLSGAFLRESPPPWSLWNPQLPPVPSQQACPKGVRALHRGDSPVSLPPHPSPPGNFPSKLFQRPRLAGMPGASLWVVGPRACVPVGVQARFARGPYAPGPLETALGSISLRPASPSEPEHAGVQGEPGSWRTLARASSPGGSRGGPVDVVGCCAPEQIHGGQVRVCIVRVLCVGRPGCREFLGRGRNWSGDGFRRTFGLGQHRGSGSGTWSELGERQVWRAR